MVKFQRRKYVSVMDKRSKMSMRIALLLGGLMICGLYMYGTGSFQDDGGNEMFYDETSYERTARRRLGSIPGTCTDPDQDSVCLGFGADSCKKLASDEMGYIAVIVLILLYLFVGIAIVCDELFVPALEIIAEQMELSNDVAGATLMAAGGSAPELATSFVGTFKRSDVGFGTIVGSAVFNVLFVIGMCVMFTPEKYSPLQLTWWPLFRDCTYYTLTLATLAIFMHDGEIELYEAIIQFIMYFGYVGMMSKSEELEKWLTEKVSGNDAKVGVETEDGDAKALDDVAEGGKAVVAGEEIKSDGSTASFIRPSTFRVGILQLLTSKQSITDTAGIAFVSQIKGDVNVVFDKIDTNKNGQLEPGELKECLLELGTPVEELNDEHIEEVMAEMDKQKHGYVTKSEFTVWYTGNEQRLKNQTREIFNKYDTDKSPPGTIMRSDVVEFMNELGHGVKSHVQEIEDAANSINSTCKDQACLTYDDFAQWYEASLFWEHEKASAEQAADAQTSMYEGILEGFNDLADSEVPTSAKANFIITLPLSLLFCLIPDCRPPGKDYLAAYTLLASIIMIALFAIVMVELAEIFGKSLGIPDVVMGLTILAAGTSVPDLLSSVIVAQQGQGDMAVSSSIGSNIFDVAFGLPLPWLVFNIVAMASGCNCNVMVASDSLIVSLLILLAMVAAIVFIIHLSEWKMTPMLGYSMFALYFIYVGVSLAITPAADYVAQSCSPFNIF